MTDKGGRREDVGNAPTTPAPDEPLPRAATATRIDPL
ncbi:MAG: hypothetical protein JWO36_5835 [Myxococcales bacterium]|nr:hypothetical protein [Myxococcales bacterium]